MSKSSAHSLLKELVDAWDGQTYGNGQAHIPGELLQAAAAYAKSKEAQEGPPRLWLVTFGRQDHGERKIREHRYVVLASSADKAKKVIEEHELTEDAVVPLEAEPWSESYVNVGMRIVDKKKTVRRERHP